MLSDYIKLKSINSLKVLKLNKVILGLTNSNREYIVSRIF
jgi:hypothetical protein